MSEPLRTILCGAGDAGGSEHQRLSFGPALIAHPAYDVVGVVDDPAAGGVERERSVQLAADLDLPVFEDFTAAAEAADVACVCSALDRRGSVVAALAASGVHLLLDKPAARTAAATRELADTVERSGVVAMPGHAMRFHPAVLRATAAVARGDIGLPWAVQSELLLAEGTTEWQNGALANGLGHSLDIVRAIIGLEATSVAAWRSSPFFAGRDEDLAVLSLTFEHDVPVSLTVGRTPTKGHPNGIAGDHLYRVMGSEGVLTVDLGKPSVQVNGGSRARRYGAGAIAAMLDHLAAAVRHQARPTLSLADAVAVAEIVEAARRASDGQVVVPLTGKTGR
ncbi:Gfo/Idh/MocA family protein [Jiangella gansuensis]|uniref:Gfo/Idh/MocA family protein n=1 Tax=Jiangella gansuensis TaxID=281473 RepID=UPI00047C1042|nr:Gfo/Idh/MocA family oxidoreductase [Jiangella gansuensis]